MNRQEIEAIEVDLLLDALDRRYGYDFRTYARASLERRIRGHLQRSEQNHISELITRVLWDRNAFDVVVREFSITVTSMFRDPGVYSSLRERVFPLLRTYPFLRIWHAGCATGEEVYSLAILLEEAGLYDRSTIFATDFNDEALRYASNGVYEIAKAKEFTEGYQKAGGARSFGDYYRAQYDSLAIDGRLKRNITWANHNLVTDGVFSEVHLVLCRNVLIYFNTELQSRVLNLILGSLARGGFLCLGAKESLQFSAVEDKFTAVDREQKIYHKNYPGHGDEHDPRA